MTKDEALKLALEALEAVAIQGDVACVVTPEKEIYLKPVITAIKEALANDALEKKAENARELGLDYEPVIDKSAAVRIATALGWTPQRTWVGLTEREQGAIMEDLNAYGTNLYPFAQAIEAKLKEKNT